MFLFFCFFLEINVTGRTKQALQKNRNRKYYCLTKKRKKWKHECKIKLHRSKDYIKKIEKNKRKK